MKSESPVFTVETKPIAGMIGQNSSEDAKQGGSTLTVSLVSTDRASESDEEGNACAQPAWSHLHDRETGNVMGQK
jgi:hypothetical protein